MMEQIQEAITQLTGAVNVQIERIKVMNNRINQLENRISPPTTDSLSSPPPTTEKDLEEMRKLPDCVRDLQVFDGNPVQYISWVHSVESILQDYAIVREKPLYRAILQHIRHKVRGPADTALISYNIFNDSWERMKTCLSLHYADKRDLRTLEHELTTLNQKNWSIDQFYARVNYQLSLIINKIKAQTHSQETIDALIESYRNRALDVFIRGLRSNISNMLIIQKPQTLPEAYASCLEIQNLNLRNYTISTGNTNNSTPVNQVYFNKQKPQQRFQPRELKAPEENRIYNAGNQPLKQPQPQTPPPRPVQPKPPVPMDVDPSLYSRRVNYINRPDNNPVWRPSNNSSNIPRKQQRLYNVQPEDGIEEDVNEEDCEEINFMTEASLAFHT